MSGCLEVGLDSRPSCQKLCLKSVSVKIRNFILTDVDDRKLVWGIIEYLSHNPPK